jgi:hypothetical protein
MRNPAKRTLSTALAMAILGYAVMLSASLAKGPNGKSAGENAFDGPPLGLPDKVLIGAGSGGCCDSKDIATPQFASSNDGAVFEWGLESGEVCPKCRKAEAAVVPVVLDVPELLGPGDASAIGAIKRKTGINVFHGSIFDGPDAPTIRLIQGEQPAELESFDHVLERIGYSGTAAAWRAVGCDIDDVTNGLKCAGKCAESPACDQVCDGERKLTAGLKVVRAFGNACYDAFGGPKVTIGSTDSTRCADTCDENRCESDDIMGSINPRRPIARFTPSSFVPSRDEDSQTDPIIALRHASHGLDKVAEHLEEQERYAEADAMREAAQQLRLKARSLKNGMSSTALIEAPLFRGPALLGETPTSSYGQPVIFDVYDSTESRQDAQQTADEAQYFEFAPKPTR